MTLHTTHEKRYCLCWRLRAHRQLIIAINITYHINIVIIIATHPILLSYHVILLYFAPFLSSTKIRRFPSNKKRLTYVPTQLLKSYPTVFLPPLYPFSFKSYTQPNTHHCIVFIHHNGITKHIHHLLTSIWTHSRTHRNIINHSTNHFSHINSLHIPSLPICPVAFSFLVSCPINVPNLKSRGFSSKLAVFNTMLVNHVKHVVPPCQDPKSPSAQTSCSSALSSASDVLSFFDSSKQIKKIFISVSKQKPTDHVFYVYCSDPSSCIQIRGVIQQHTSITTLDVLVRYIVGRVSSIPHDMSTADLMALIQHQDPRIKSLVITRIIHAHPSSHFRCSAYFYIQVDELDYLKGLAPLPGHKLPMLWEKLILPSVALCTLCFDDKHRRRQCPLLGKVKYCCAKCKEPNHLAKQCSKPTKCFICHDHDHTAVQCKQYRPTYIPIPLIPSLDQFLSLPSRPTSAPAIRSSPATSNAQRTTASAPPSLKRSRHTSFDMNSEFSFGSRGNHSPLSPDFQHYLDNSSLTRSSCSTPSSPLPYVCVVASSHSGRTPHPIQLHLLYFLTSGPGADSIPERNHL